VKLRLGRALRIDFVPEIAPHANFFLGTPKQNTISIIIAMQQHLKHALTEAISDAVGEPSSYIGKSSG